MKANWRRGRRGAVLLDGEKLGSCCVPGCSAKRFPGLLHCFEHASKDALALLVEEAVRRGYRPGSLKVV